MSIMCECIPKATISQQQDITWLNRWIKVKIRKRNNTYKKARAGDSSLWSKNLSLWNEVV